MVLCVITAVTVPVACSSKPNGGTKPVTTAVTATVPTSPFGSASVQPDTLRGGSAFTVVPASEIEPICRQIADIYTRSEPPRFVGALGLDGTWQASSEGTPVTYPPCQPQRSRNAESFSLPVAGLPAGVYVVCLETLAPDLSPRDRAGCGPMTVETG
jgi:hypothetical protein